MTGEEGGSHPPDFSSTPPSQVSSLYVERFPLLGPDRELPETWTLTQAREGLRGTIALWLLAILTVVVVVALIDVSKLTFTTQSSTVDDLRTVLEILVTPLVGLIGAVTGFYFGTRAVDGASGDSN